MRQSQEALLGDLATYLFYMIIGIFFIFPIFWSFSVALGSQEDVLFDGLRIRPEDTPRMLEMENGDVIDAILEDPH